MSNSLQPFVLQHTRFPCSSPEFAQVHAHWCHLTVSVMTYNLPILLPPSPPTLKLYHHHESAFHIKGPKYWSFSFSISPSNEYAGLISFRIDWFDLPSIQGIHKSLLHTIVQKHWLLALSLLYGPTLTPLYDYRKNHSLDYTDHCQQSSYQDRNLAIINYISFSLSFSLINHINLCLQ